MCRIAGIISNTAEGRLAASVKAMCDSMRHGGPDDEGLWEDANTGVCLGHRRLSLLDLTSAGRQPMEANNGRLMITFNGEIYNFKDIRAELEQHNYTFVTATDIEVILKVYLHWGTASF